MARRSLALASLSGLLLSLVDCSGAPAGARNEQAPPARVQAPVKETELTTVTLTSEAETRLGIQITPVARQTVSRTRTLGGEITVPPGGAVLVSAPVAGTLQPPSGGVPAAGSFVQRGQTIFRLLPIAPAERDIRIDVEREVADASARLEAATSRARRTEQLLRDGAGSRRAFEEAQADLAVAAAALKAAQDRAALVNRSPVSAGGVDIAAPLASILRTIHASPGQSVAASSPLFEVARIDPVWVRVPLYVGDASSVDLSRGAAIGALGDKADAPTRIARRVTAPPSADPSTAAVDVFFQLSNHDGAFLPGQKVSARLTLHGGDSRLVVPKSALLHDAFGGTWVYENPQPHLFVRRRVAVEDVIESLAVLSQGPPAGARIVTTGAAELFGTEFGAGK